MTVPSQQNRSSTRPMILFVLGMGRSGTSALTRVLSLCGAALPTGMMGADTGNPRGYWEPRAALLLNRAILDRHGSAWWDPSFRLLEEGTFTPEERAQCIAEIGEFLDKLPPAPLVVIKELTIGVLHSMWFEAARQAGYDISAVISVRHPEEVVASLGAAVKATPELTSALWLKGNLLAERYTRDIPRAFIEYSNLLDDWRREINRISSALGVDLTPADEAPIDAFLAQGLHRQRHSADVVDRFGTDWVSEVYEAMRAAAADGDLDLATLDRVFEAYQATERDFRKAFDCSRGYQDGVLNKLVRPSIAKPILELRAIAHRRKGTWV
ncbi:sulfotransferase family protein [Mycolicibacterium brisbanense]|nr:sulfotransferase family protein [Mycolicibacterium brisbanense]MCV7160943.1 sulfotransferase family protein [Mycolicibacterium brisbanense]